MIISHKYKFIFIKTRRTGTSSFEVEIIPFLGKKDVLTPVLSIEQNTKGWFNPIPDIIFFLRYRREYNEGLIKRLEHKKKFYPHIPAYVVRARIGRKMWNSYFKFTIERDPIEKEVSLYMHHKNVYHKNENYTFEDYWKEKDRCINYPLYTNLLGKPIVDFVVRYSHLEEDLHFVCDKLGIPFKGLHFKITQHNFTNENKKELLRYVKKKYGDKIMRIYSKETKILKKFGIKL